MTNIEPIILIYSMIAGISAFASGLYLLEQEIEGIDGFWDWVIWNTLWIIQPIIKFFRNII